MAKKGRSGSKWLLMAGDGWKWLERLEMAGNGLKILEMSENCWNGLKLLLITGMV